MPALDELPAIYGANTIDPPAAHIVAAAMAALYLLLFLGFALMWLGARAAEKRARAARSDALAVGPAQLLGTIAGTARILAAPGDGNRVVSVPVEPFTLETAHGPVRIAPGAPVTFHAGRLVERPLRGGERVEVAGALATEKRPDPESYRGDLTEGWVLKEPATGDGVQLWRFSRSASAWSRRRAGKTGMLAALAFALFSTLSLTGYLSRLAFGETTEATLVAVGEPTRHGVDATIDLDHDDLVVETLPASEASALREGPIAYRHVAALPSLGAVGPGVAMPGSAFFFAILFLVCALAGSVAIVATELEGG